MSETSRYMGSRDNMDLSLVDGDESYFYFAFYCCHKKLGEYKIWILDQLLAIHQRFSL